MCMRGSFEWKGALLAALYSVSVACNSCVRMRACPCCARWHGCCKLGVTDRLEKLETLSCKLPALAPRKGPLPPPGRAARLSPGPGTGIPRLIMHGLALHACAAWRPRLTVP